MGIGQWGGEEWDEGNNGGVREIMFLYDGLDCLAVELGFLVGMTFGHVMDKKWVQWMEEWPWVSHGGVRRCDDEDVRKSFPYKVD